MSHGRRLNSTKKKSGADKPENSWVESNYFLRLPCLLRPWVTWHASVQNNRSAVRWVSNWNLSGVFWVLTSTHEFKNCVLIMCVKEKMRPASTAWVFFFNFFNENTSIPFPHWVLLPTLSVWKQLLTNRVPSKQCLHFSWVRAPTIWEVRS